jgi:hypothetical protein
MVMPTLREGDSGGRERSDGRDREQGARQPDQPET